MTDSGRVTWEIIDGNTVKEERHPKHISNTKRLKDLDLQIGCYKTSEGRKRITNTKHQCFLNKPPKRLKYFLPLNRKNADQRLNRTVLSGSQHTKVRILKNSERNTPPYTSQKRLQEKYELLLHVRRLQLKLLDLYTGNPVKRLTPQV